MSRLQHGLAFLDADRLGGMRRGIEKESLRVGPDATLARTAHPTALGSALTHPHITTDFSESQLELITGVHASAQGCIDELTELHQVVYRAIGEERLWVASMPCRLPADADIPLGRYGDSHVGRTKTIYRRGLGHRYGRRMQTISGIHYNWSLPGLSNEDYFGLIRNFRRHAFVLLYLFGASPALCTCFAEGQPHSLQTLGPDTLHLPHATSLRMGRLGYQSEAQAALAVSYNSLERYGASLQDALTRPYGPYEALGVRDAQGEYRQLSTSVLQIENEFYGTIRPKRTIRSGERPLHALRERGVEYIEVRCMDLDPFVDVGIEADTARFIDTFLLFCLLSDSPPDTPEEIAALGRNQHRAAERGREPGLRLERAGAEVTLIDWLDEVLAACGPIAAHLDAQLGGTAYREALAAAKAKLAQPAVLPSARFLAELRNGPTPSMAAWVQARSEAVRTAMLSQDADPERMARWARLAETSLAEQVRVAQADVGSYEDFLAAYLSVDRLM